MKTTAEVTDQPKRRLRAAGAGHSGRSDIAERIEEILVEASDKGSTDRHPIAAGDLAADKE